ncbi:MAG: class A beta-lactamase [Bdellovibrionaceae bacterium]|nr:class A beta-lactamase [Pseudobdellovibrionaceae bacterium]
MPKLLFALFLVGISLTAGANPKSILALQAIERGIGGHLGVIAIDTKTGRRIEYKSAKRFLMCSTFKLSLVAHILKRADSGEEKLDRLISFSPADLLEYAPVTSRRVSEKKMSIKDLSIAVLQYSDNTAANLLLHEQGGPAGLTQFLRSIGDQITRIDRSEPALNTPKGDFDTTTPEAIAETVRKLVLGDVLSPTSRAFFTEWLLSNAVSNARFRAGVPDSWKVADRGGSGDGGVTNDIGVLFGPNDQKIVLAAFTSGSTKPRSEIEKALAEVAKLATAEFADH